MEFTRSKNRLTSLPLVAGLRLRMRGLVAVFMSLMLIALGGVAQAASKAEMQQEIRTTTRETLTRLYKSAPGARKAIEGAAGYAVFSNFGMKILIAGGAPARVWWLTTRRKRRPS